MPSSAHGHKEKMKKQYTSKFEQYTVIQHSAYAHTRADMPRVPSSWLGYAQMCAPSPLRRQAQHLNPVRNAFPSGS